MTPERVQVERRALALFERLADRGGDDRFRARLLAQEDAAVIARVEALERSAQAAARSLPTELPDSGIAGSAAAPERVGPFRLQVLVGEGGMGQVWRAVRDDGLYEQTVAVKLIHGGLAALTADRFADERRILARLEHPGIARLIDGGASPEGARYLVMEYVDGAPIDEAAAPKPVRERVQLFLKVLEAVEFAHSRLVVHADLKPSNVLVTDRGWVKLLDFGVARLLDQASPEMGRHPLTPAYASPARLAGDEPTISDDLFALGKILHELVETTDDEDLLAIAAKAAAQTEAERYGSVAALAGDLHRWSERLPVSARPATTRYRLSRFFARHAVAVSATGAALALLSASTLAATINYLQAEAARREASARFEDVRGTARYLLYDLSDELERLPNSLALRTEVARVSQGYLDRLAGSAGASDAVRLESAEGLLRLGERQGRPGRPNLGQGEAARRSLDRALATLEPLEGARAARLRGEVLIARSHLEAQTFSETDRAERSLAEAAPLVGGAGLEGEYLLALASLRLTQGRYREAMQAAQAVSRSPGVGDERRSRVAQASALDVLADATYYAGDVRGSADVYRRSVEAWDALLRRWPGDPIAIRRAPRARYGLGTVLVDVSPEDAPPVLARAAAEAGAVSARDPDDAETGRMHQVIEGAHAQSLAAIGRRAEAVAVVERLMRARREQWRAAPAEARRLRDYAITVAMLADMEADGGQEASACRRYEEVTGLFDQLARTDRHIKLDEDHALRLVRDRQLKHCRA